MILSFFILVALVGVAIGSYTDIRTLEVPDWLNYSMVAIGIGGNLIHSVFSSDYSFILNSLAGLALAFFLGMLMFLTGQWGGGDSKVLFGIGALVGLEYNKIIQSPLDMDVFFINFLVNMLFAGAIYGVIWIFGMAIKNRKEVGKKIRKNFNDKKLSRVRLFSGLFAVVCLLIIYLVPVAVDGKIKIIFSVLVILLYFMNYLFLIVRAVEESAMIKFVKPEKLTEGDWIVDEIKIDGRYIAGPKDLGIEKKKIDELIRLKSEGKISRVKVKYGIPFVPSFLIALVYTMLTNSIVLMQFI